MNDETQTREMEKDMARDAEEIVALKGRIAELEEQLREAKGEIPMKPCPCCWHGQWEAECCNGADGCSCRGQRVPMGRCNVCDGTGQVREDMQGVDTFANSRAIAGRCFIG